MRKTVGSILMALCLILLCMCMALCEGTARYASEEIDLSGVREIDGRLVGEVPLPAFSKLPLKIDCAIPAAFTEEQSALLTVEYPKITKQQLQKTLKALGIVADEKKGTFGQFLHNPERIVWYEQGDFRHIASSSMVCHRSAEYFLSEDLHTTALTAAKETTARIINALGGVAYKPLLQAEYYGEHLVWPFSTTGSTTDEKLKALACRTFHENKEKYGPNGDDVYTVYGLYEVLGLPVINQATYRSGGDQFAYAQDFSGIFKESGELLGFEINCLPVIKSKDSLPLPERSWEELLRLWISHCYTDGYSLAEDETFQDDVFGEVTYYASYCTLTELQPCWITTEKYQLEPGFNAVIEVRIRKDDSLASVWTHYTDALTLTKNEY